MLVACKIQRLFYFFLLNIEEFVCEGNINKLTRCWGYQPHQLQIDPKSEQMLKAMDLNNVCIYIYITHMYIRHSASCEGVFSYPVLP